MGARAFALALLALLSGIARSADAQPAIAVERSPGAEDCPDTDDLTARVVAILGPATPPSGTYLVTFSHAAQTFSAAIRGGADGATVRYLHAREGSCAALAHATALALAVLFDADLAGSSVESAPTAASDDGGSSAKPGPRQPPSSRPPAPAEQRTDEVRTPHADRQVAPLFSLGGGAVVGLLRPVVPAVVADAGLSIGRVRATIGALWVPSQTLRLSPGSANETTVAGSIRACYDVFRGPAWSFDGCSGALVGAANAEARGFAVNERRTELVLAFPIETVVAARKGLVRWEFGATALIMSPPLEFRVDGRGLTYHPSPVAGAFLLRAVLEPR